MIVGRGTPLVVLFAIFLLGAERLFPGRPLPHSPGWYTRATRSFERMDFRVVE